MRLYLSSFRIGCAGEELRRLSRGGRTLRDGDVLVVDGDDERLHRAGDAGDPRWSSP